MNENMSLEAIILGLGVGGDGKKWYKLDMCGSLKMCEWGYSMGFWAWELPQLGEAEEAG